MLNRHRTWGREGKSSATLVGREGPARSQGSESGQIPFFEQFECGAAAARDVIDTAFQAEVVERRRGLAAAHNGEPRARGDCFGESAGTFCKSSVLKYAHGPVPEDCTGAADGLGEAHTGSWADVNSLPTWQEIDTELAHDSGWWRTEPQYSVRR